MEICSVMELSSTVLKVSHQIYKFLKALQNAPAEVAEYRDSLESTRKVLLDVHEYADVHERSTLVAPMSSTGAEDGLRLRTLRMVLLDCELVFVAQWNVLKGYESDDSLSWFRRASKRCEFVWGREALERSTTKLEASRALLVHAISTSTGKNTVLIRNALSSVASDVQQMRAEEIVHRELYVQKMDQYTSQLQAGIATMMTIAKRTGQHNTAQLELMADAVNLQLEGATFQGELRANVPSGKGGRDSDVVNAYEDTEVILGDLADGDTPQDGGRSVPMRESPATGAKLAGNQQHPSAPKSEHIGSSGLSDKIQVRLASYVEQLSQQQRRVQLLAIAKIKKEKSTNSDVSGALSAQLGLPGIDPIVQGSKQFAVLLSGTLWSIDWDKGLYDVFSAGIEELKHVMSICTQELELYPHDHNIIDLVMQAYEYLLEATSELSTIASYAIANPRKYKKITRKPLLVSFIYPKETLATHTASLHQQVAGIRRISERLRQQVDIAHRREMRETSRKVTEVHIQQHEIADMLREQKLLVESLQQERQIMDLAREQQKVLQAMQKIEQALRLQTTGTVNCT